MKEQFIIQSIDNIVVSLFLINLGYICVFEKLKEGWISMKNINK